MLSRAQNSLYWREWSATKRALMPGRSTWTRHEEETYRHAVHREALGYDKSHLDFSNAEFDRVLRKLRELRDPDNLDAVMAVLAFWNHDQAQAAHVPVVRPGKSQKRYGRGGKKGFRRNASFYEHITPVDDPDERKRLVYVVSRLFASPLVEKICFDRWQARAWRELPLPQLTELRDLLKARLGKFITRRRKNCDDAGFWRTFGFSGFDPATGRDWTNKEIIGILLRRGVAIDMRSGADPKFAQNRKLTGKCLSGRAGLSRTPVKPASGARLPHSSEPEGSTADTEVEEAPF